VAAEGNDLSMSFDWRPVELTPNRSCSCEVSGASDHVLTVRIEQPPYDRTLRGQGAVKVVAIPSAAVGTRGKLIARDETSGATAEYMWEWKPIKAAKWITPQKTETRNAAGQKRPTKSRQTWTPASTTSKSFFGMLVGAADLAAAAAAPSRYAFILDMSGSMILSGNRWEICRLQLASALGGLPAAAKLFVILFSTKLAMPPGQTEWMQGELLTDGMFCREKWRQAMLNCVSHNFW
jgi:hypothetical protein